MMRTKTARLSVIAHVPVDRFEITWGPAAAACMQALEKLTREATRLPKRTEPFYASLTFTLKTAASEEVFVRQLKVASIYGVRNGEFEFTAVFNGRIVSGVYNMNSRRGWFNLD